MHRVVINHGNEIRSVPFALTDDVFRIVIRGMQILPPSISGSDQIVRLVPENALRKRILLRFGMVRNRLRS